MNAATGLTKKWVLSSAIAAMTISVPFTFKTQAAAPLKPTQVKINPAQTLKMGSEGKAVHLLQRILYKRNLYHGKLDGLYGPQTQTAVMLYQQAKELKVDGVAGPKTLGSLLKVEGRYVPSTRTLSVGDRGKAVRTVQTKLKKLGYYPHKVDGIFGTITKDSVKTFQAMNDLKIDGIVGPETKKKLFQSDATRLTPRVKKAKPKNVKIYQASESISKPEPKKVPSQNGKSVSTGQESANVAVQASSSTGDIEGILSEAKKLIGTPYRWGGTTPSGFDCSGYVDYVFAKFNIQLPRTVSSIWNYGVPIDHPQPGDLVFFETYKSGPSHIGIYLGHNRFLHADADDGIKISSLTLDYWKNHYIGAERVVQSH